MNTQTNEAISFPFSAYDSKNAPTEEENNRLSKCLYRADSKENYENAYVRIPLISEAEVTEQIDVLMPHIISYLEGVQDDIIKSHHKSGYTSVLATAIELSAIIDKLDSTDQGRLNKEKVFQWFDTSVKDMLVVAFADKLGISDNPSTEDEDKLNSIVSVYRTKFGALAGGKSVFVPSEAEKLQAAITATGADSTALGTRFLARLEKMKTPEDILAGL